MRSHTLVEWRWQITVERVRLIVSIISILSSLESRRMLDAPQVDETGISLTLVGGWINMMEIQRQNDPTGISLFSSGVHSLHFVLCFPRQLGIPVELHVDLHFSVSVSSTRIVRKNSIIFKFFSPSLEIHIRFIFTNVSMFRTQHLQCFIVQANNLNFTPTVAIQLWWRSRRGGMPNVWRSKTLGKLRWIQPQALENLLDV